MATTTGKIRNDPEPGRRAKGQEVRKAKGRNDPDPGRRAKSQKAEKRNDPDPGRKAKSWKAKKDRRQYYRNPERVSTVSITKPQTLIMPLLVGVGAKITTDKVPKLLNLTGNTRLLAQAGVGVVGGMLLRKVVGNLGATIWLVVAGTTVVTSLLQNMGLNLAGADDIPYQPGMEYEEEVPDYSPSMLEAYPEELGAYPMETY